MFEGLPLELLTTENGIWILIALVGLREWGHIARDRRGPAWVKNGAMDAVLDKFTLRLQDVLERSQATFKDLPAKNHEILKTSQERSTREIALLEKITHRLDSIPQFDERQKGIVLKMEECSDQLKGNSKVLKAVVRELNNSPMCAYRPADRVALAEDLHRRRQADAHTRAEDLGVDLEED